MFAKLNSCVHVKIVLLAISNVIKPRNHNFPVGDWWQEGKLRCKGGRNPPGDGRREGGKWNSRGGGSRIAGRNSLLRLIDSGAKMWGQLRKTGDKSYGKREVQIPLTLTPTFSYALIGWWLVFIFHFSFAYAMILMDNFECRDRTEITNCSRSQFLSFMIYFLSFRNFYQ